MVVEADERGDSACHHRHVRSNAATALAFVEQHAREYPNSTLEQTPASASSTGSRPRDDPPA